MCGPTVVVLTYQIPPPAPPGTREIVENAEGCKGTES